MKLHYQETLGLGKNTLCHVSSGVVVPLCAREKVSVGIVHLGVGNFHRAHQAVFTDDVLAAGDLSWGILGVSLRSPRIKTILHAQDCLYSVHFRESSCEHSRVIGSITKLLCAPENPEAVLQAMCNPQVKIVSLTITEKGYVWPEGQLPDWTPARFYQSDASALLYLVEALARRHKLGIAPFTVLSCDNLAANGNTLKAAILQLAHHKTADFAAYLAQSLACPSTMVDRIVPASTPSDLALSNSLLGLQDNAAIVTEGFGQWVIEDNFPSGRPDWSVAKEVVFTKDVASYEKMKLRLLNGAHTFIALYGQLTGCTYVSDVMQQQAVVQFLYRLWNNAIHTLQIDEDLSDYIQRLILRFRNKNLLHKTSQIVQDTSQKLPQRILEPLLELHQLGRETQAHSTVIALWIEHLRRAKRLEDPLSSQLLPLAQAGDVSRFIQEVPIFCEDYQKNTQLINEVMLVYKDLQKGGVAGLLSRLEGVAELNGLNSPSLEGCPLGRGGF